MNPYLENTIPNYWLSCILIDKSCKLNCMQLYEKLQEENIESRPIWKPMHMQPVFKNNDCVKVENSYVDEDIFSRGLCLPSDIKMNKEDQLRVVDSIKDFFNE